MTELNLWNLFIKHSGKIIGGLLGLLIAVLMLKYGFWKTLFILIAVGVGIFLGWRLDLNDGVRGLLDRLFSPRDDY
ncbi:MAG TPA: DUF2273 domain-containing protein [Bacillota bacterium]|jgi:uncharacterized membrane protein|nr:DUF2273 domain-containing protein [Bacillota bacterium]HOB87167.1 DUF2273 domain-containing protein [Bacillota bacterium]HOP68944.1 DUF2273 domain-containing protein [Bacillota bacterium]HPT33908.1 DUF2273 domain-containing protein [Bacillota bacterium]HPZ64299.1 DUF2273 domain-containing protein [Bacillota bacterium]